MKVKYIFSYILILIIPLFPVFSAEIFEAPENIDDLNLQVVKILNNVTHDKMEPNDLTQGFSYRHEAKWSSAFYLNVYLTRVNKSNKLSLVRIESPLAGTEKVFKQILEAELLKEGRYPDKSNLRNKHYLFGSALAMIHPSLSVFYNARKSPLYSVNDTTSKMTKYFFTDLLLVGAAIWYSNTKYRANSPLETLLLKPPEEKNPLRGKNAGLVIGALLTTRIIRLAGSMQDTAAHNNLVQFLYSKNY